MQHSTASLTVVYGSWGWGAGAGNFLSIGGERRAMAMASFLAMERSGEPCSSKREWTERWGC